MIIDCCLHLSPNCATYITAYSSLLTGIAAALLAYWAIKTYFSSREHETKLSIDFDQKDFILNGTDRVYLDIILKNEGMVAIHTKKRFIKGSDGKAKTIDFTSEDEIETILYSVELQIKKIKNSNLTYDWYDKNQYDPIHEHINLLKDLEIPSDYKHPAFFIEPKETYHFGCWLQLDKGLYEAKVIVIGVKQPDDFWHRKFPFEVK